MLYLGIVCVEGFMYSTTLESQAAQRNVGYFRFCNLKYTKDLQMKSCFQKRSKCLSFILLSALLDLATDEESLRQEVFKTLPLNVQLQCLYLSFPEIVRANSVPSGKLWEAIVCFCILFSPFLFESLKYM